MTAPGVWENVSQIDGVRPSSATAPSIWYDAVAAPHTKPSGKRAERSGAVVVCSDVPSVCWTVIP